jgi:hypothetical protein
MFYTIGIDSCMILFITTVGSSLSLALPPSCEHLVKIYHHDSRSTGTPATKICRLIKERTLFYSHHLLCN